MAGQSGQNPLAGKMKGLAAAVGASRGKPIDVAQSRFGRLPAGINNGVLRLSSVGFYQYPADHKNVNYRGKLYFNAAGVVVSPTDHQGAVVRGLQSRLRAGGEPMFDTPEAKGAKARKTQQEHYDYMRAYLTTFGFNPDMIAIPSGTADPDAYVLAALKAGCKALEEQSRREGIFVRFRTWAGAKDEIVCENGKWFVVRRNGRLGPYASKELLLKINPYAESDPMVNEQWEGVVDFSENGGVPPVEDNTGAAEEVVDGSTGDSPAEGDESVATATADFDSMTVEELAAAAQEFADAEDTEGVNEAGEKLLEIADGLGIRQEVHDSDSWADGASLILTAQALAAQTESGDDGQEAEEDDPPAVPAKGEVWMWKPVDPKNPKKRGKAIEVIVASVNAKSETVTITDNKTKKPVLGKDKKPLVVPFADLESPE